jgi:hypothetical protein
MRFHPFRRVFPVLTTLKASASLTARTFGIGTWYLAFKMILNVDACNCNQQNIPLSPSVSVLSHWIMPFQRFPFVDPEDKLESLLPLVHRLRPFVSSPRVALSICAFGPRIRIIVSNTAQDRNGYLLRITLLVIKLCFPLTQLFRNL